jgi:uncharacterized membrane protein YoaK (UPF0700 family)
MTVLTSADRRDRRHDYWLGGSTALVAGLVNVCSVIGFFAFAANVTGHVAVLSEELVKGHWHQLGVVGAWIAAFLAGAFAANGLATHVAPENPLIGRSLALSLEIALLFAVGYYGDRYYAETLTETEYLVGVLLFAMGLQNGLVATISKGVVKTTHLTGLLTDLGVEISMSLQRRFQNDEGLRFKLRLHLLVFVAYLVGGAAGGALFVQFGFPTFYAGSAILGTLLALDLLALRASSSELWPAAAARHDERRLHAAGRVRGDSRISRST